MHESPEAIKRTMDFGHLIQNVIDTYVSSELHNTIHVFFYESDM